MPRPKRQPLPKPVDIFLVAEQFRATAALAINIPIAAQHIPALSEARGLWLPTAYMACKAFALELYLKCLIRLGRKSFGKAHDLHELFYLVGRRNRAKIKRYWNANSAQVVLDLYNAYKDTERPIPRLDFEFVLTLSKDAFTIMRYVHEGVPPDTGWAGDTIVEGARTTILEMYPQWERLRQLYPSPMISYQPPATFPIR